MSLDYLCEDVLREIGKYLDYNSRLNYNQCIPFEARFVRKLKSDEHNLLVKCRLLTHKIERISSSPQKHIKCFRLISMFSYLANTKDSVLFTKGTPMFHATLVAKLDELTQENTYNGIFYKIRIRNKVLSSAKRLSLKIRIKLIDLPRDKILNEAFVEII